MMANIPSITFLAVLTVLLAFSVGECCLGTPCNFFKDCCNGTVCVNNKCAKCHAEGTKCDEGETECCPSAPFCVERKCTKCVPQGGHCLYSADCCGHQCIRTSCLWD